MNPEGGSAGDAGTLTAMSDLERLAHDTALRALDKQERVLEELRARTGGLLAAASLTAGVFRSRALDDVNLEAVG